MEFAAEGSTQGTIWMTQQHFLWFMVVELLRIILIYMFIQVVPGKMPRLHWVLECGDRHSFLCKLHYWAFASVNNVEMIFIISQLLHLIIFFPQTISIFEISSYVFSIYTESRTLLILNVLIACMSVSKFLRSLVPFKRVEN